MPAAEAIGLHFELEFRIVFTVVIALAASVAFLRYIPAAHRRRIDEADAVDEDDMSDSGTGS
ncbi:MAG: hypothetical protein ACYC77_09620 [Coriobacteriia bacterium]